jgi:hypothetical protein
VRGHEDGLHDRRTLATAGWELVRSISTSDSDAALRQDNDLNNQRR